MFLDKHTGLYTLPSHDLHGERPASRPSFNSMDFAADEVEMPDGDGGPVQPVKDGNNASHFLKESENKRKKKQSTAMQVVQYATGPTLATSTPYIEITPATASSKSNKSEERQNNAKTNARSGKKRKRENGVQARNSSVARILSGSSGFVVGANMLQKVRTSIKAAGAVFGDCSMATEPTKKAMKNKETKTPLKSDETIDFDRMAKEARSVGNKDKQIEKKEKKRQRSEGVVPTKDPVRVLLPPIFSSSPRNTPVPLPSNDFSRAVKAIKADRVGRRDSRLLVLETPPSQLSKTPVNLPDSPIPFNLPRAGKANGRKKSMKMAGLSPPISALKEVHSLAPPALNKNHKLKLKPDGRVSLTTSNLIMYTQPLNDEARPRPLSRAMSIAASTTGSTTSGGTSQSIKDYFTRAGRSCSVSGLELDPFMISGVKKKVVRETHEEASRKEFTEKYRVVQKAVNFSDELKHLEKSLSWRIDNGALGPLPCLGIKASGCNMKREQVLRLSKEDPSNLLKVLVTTEAGQTALEDAGLRSTEAESFLMMAIAAFVPIPIGRLEGVWKLYCPQYSDVHIDKYGYGQRTLTIFPIAGFKDQHSYTARLSIPPRSMLYSILSFSVPPHASFRTTAIKTSVEGYEMDIIFLGNGYLQLRVDLGLLLSGKPTETREGKRIVMEFVGVHERAVAWKEKKDEL